eukprot:scaffold20842_cov33-Tisochrysis_lutea.AAC.11
MECAESSSSGLRRYTDRDEYRLSSEPTVECPSVKKTHGKINPESLGADFDEAPARGGLDWRR